MEKRGRERGFFSFPSFLFLLFSRLPCFFLPATAPPFSLQAIIITNNKKLIISFYFSQYRRSVDMQDTENKQERVMESDTTSLLLSDQKSTRRIGSRERNSLEQPKPLDQIKIEVDLKRWFMLAIFSFISCTNAMQWITFAPISTLMAKSYDVKAFWINLLSMIYMYV